MSWLAMWVVLGSAAAGDEPDERGAWTPEQWIAAVDGQASSHAAMRYSATRSTQRGDVTVEERWRYIADGAGRFRIDYFGDTARQVTCDKQVLVDYVPANGSAVRVDLDALSAADLSSMMDGVLSKVAVPGVRVGHAEDVAWTFGEGVPGVRVLLGEGRDDTRLVYHLHEERLVILRSEIHEDGQVVLRTESSDHREISPGAWFPHRVEMRAPEAEGEVRVEVRLTKVRVVTDPPAHLFTTELDDSIPIKEMP